MTTLKSLRRKLWMLLLFVLVHATSCFAASEFASVRNLQHAETLAAAGVMPELVVNVGGAVFELSHPIMLDESRQIAVAWITIEAEKAIRLLYRSNSQCSWRVCDATTPTHIGKGFHEFDKQVPIDVTLALLRAADEVVELKAWFEHDGAEVTQYALADKLLRLLTADRDTGIKSGDVVTYGGKYITREYASTIPCVPVPFSIARGELKTAGDGTVVDPAKTDLPDRPRLPNLQSEVSRVTFTIPWYARFVGGSGQLTGRVYLSHDKTIRYLFTEDQQQRVMLSGAELLTAPVTLLGVRSRYLDTGGMDTPLMEYGAQIPEKYGGRKSYRYQSAWPLVRELPIVQLYYRELQTPVPPAELR